MVRTTVLYFLDFKCKVRHCATQGMLAPAAGYGKCLTALIWNT